MPFIDRNATVARIALDHPSCALVFRDHRIDFCCRGALTLKEACAGKAIDADTLLAELQRAAFSSAAAAPGTTARAARPTARARKRSMPRG